jgi:hypothetical protein
VASAVTTTNLYPWKLEVKGNYSNGNVFDRIVSGSSYVVINDPSWPYGYGWTLSGVDRLVPVTNGVEWLYGSGGTRFFNGGPIIYNRPPNDFGTLNGNGDGSYTYVSKQRFRWDFDVNGILTKITDPHGLIRTFTYSSGRLTITEPDLTVATYVPV